MSQEPKVTRFGADPTVDQELATKIYVDNSSGGGGAPSFVIGGYVASAAVNTLTFTNFVNVNPDPSETNSQAAFANACTLRRMTWRSQVNTRVVVTTLGLRINGADGNMTIDVPASTTGVFRDLVNTDAIADADLCNYKIDSSGGGGGFFFNRGSIMEVVT